MEFQVDTINSKISGNEKGFTLIEMAIVLIIIGIIIGAVMKGRDLIKSAQTKNVYQTFYAAHYKLISSYYDKTGQVLGDGTINGGTRSNTDGYMDGFVLDASHREAIVKTLKAVGIDPCTLIKSNLTSKECGDNGPNIGQISIDGEYLRYTSTVGYYTGSFDGRTRNYLRIGGLPTDFAIALDKMIDGVANCSAGNFKGLGVCQKNGMWPDASQTKVVSAAWLTEF